MRLTIDEQLTETIIQQIKKGLHHREDLVIRPVKIDDANVYVCYLTETVDIDALVSPSRTFEQFLLVNFEQFSGQIGFRGISNDDFLLGIE